MNIDMGALHAIEVDRGISVDELLDTIKSALLTAYRHTQGHEADARIDIDRKSGIVKVMAQGDRRRRQPDQRMGRHPRGFRPGRGHHRPPGDAAAVPGRRERADVRRVLGAGGRHRRRRGPARRPGEHPRQRRRAARHRGEGFRGSHPARRAGARGVLRARRSVALLRHRRDARCARTEDRVVAHPPEPGAQAVLAGSARDRRQLRGDRRGRPRGGHRSKIAVHVAGRRVSTPRAPASARWGSGCAT